MCGLLWGFLSHPTAYHGRTAIACRSYQSVPAWRSMPRVCGLPGRFRKYVRFRSISDVTVCPALISMGKRAPLSSHRVLRHIFRKTCLENGEPAASGGMCDAAVVRERGEAETESVKLNIESSICHLTPKTLYGAVRAIVWLFLQHAFTHSSASYHFAFKLLLHRS